MHSIHVHATIPHSTLCGQALVDLTGKQQKKSLPSQTTQRARTIGKRQRYLFPLRKYKEEVKNWSKEFGWPTERRNQGLTKRLASNKINLSTYVYVHGKSSKKTNIAEHKRQHNTDCKIQSQEVLNTGHCLGQNKMEP